MTRYAPCAASIYLCGLTRDVDGHSFTHHPVRSRSCWCSCFGALWTARSASNITHTASLMRMMSARHSTQIWRTRRPGRPSSAVRL